jgi:glutathione S-transferase
VRDVTVSGLRCSLGAMSERPILYVGEKNVSSWSMRAWVAMTWKEVAFEERTILLTQDKSRAERRKVSPTGKLPVLHHGGIVVPDSLAIIEYLEETFPPPSYPALWPADRVLRARARWLSAAMHSGFMKVREGMSFNLCFLPEVPAAPADALSEAQEVLAMWEDALTRSDRRGGPYLCGAFCGADVMFATMAARLVAFKVPTSDYPHARDYLTTVLNAPPVKAWMDQARKLPPQASY